MRFVALATDYDNTIATDGKVAERTWSALERLRQSGRHLVLVSGRELDDLDAHGTIALLAGPSGGGKSTVTAALLERLGQAGYQACIFDPEGDYGHEGDLVALGDAHTIPSLESAVQLLSNPKQSIAVNMLRIPLVERPRYCASLLLRLQALRVQTGRPHWLVFEEAHQLFPADWNPADESLPAMLETAFAVTVHPEQVAPALLRQVNTALVTGMHPDKTLAAFAEAVGRRSPRVDAGQTLERGQLLVWRPQLDAHGRDAQAQPYMVNVGEVIGDEELASEARTIEREAANDASESRARIRAAVESRYTQPENPSLPPLRAS